MMMKKKQMDGQPAGHRLRKMVDGPEIMRRYSTMATAELARLLGLTVKQIKNFVYRENTEKGTRKSKSIRSLINSENGKKGGRPRKKCK